MAGSNVSGGNGGPGSQDLGDQAKASFRIKIELSSGQCTCKGGCGCPSPPVPRETNTAVFRFPGTVVQNPQNHLATPIPIRNRSDSITTETSSYGGRPNLTGNSYEAHGPYCDAVCRGQDPEHCDRLYELEDLAHLAEAIHEDPLRYFLSPPAEVPQSWDAAGAIEAEQLTESMCVERDPNSTESSKLLSDYDSSFPASRGSLSEIIIHAGSKFQPM